MLAALSLLLACQRTPAPPPGSDSGGADTGADAWRPDLVCPGDPGCASADGDLLAGAARRVITPTCFEGWQDADGDAKYEPSTDAFLDCGCDRLCEGDAGWTAADEGEGDGIFQAMWIAGFGQARAANGVHDDLEARAVVLRQGEVTVALVTLDVVGWFYDDAQAIEDEVVRRGLDVDAVVVHSSHVHEAPDTLGQWGPSLTGAGTDRAWMDEIVQSSADAVEEAVDGLQPATLRLGSIDTAAPFGDKGTRNLVRDSRDPVVIDERLSVARLAASDGQTIATLINWSNHPEAVGSDNLDITADFVHPLRRAVEEGVGARPGTGGLCLFVNGTVGGLMTPLGVTVTDDDGVDWSGDNFDKADAIGRVVGGLALEALDAADDVADPDLRFRSTRLLIPVENVAFQALFLIGIFDRQLHDYDPDQEISETNQPKVETRIDLVEVGPLSMLTVPGELAPEVAIGGYDGSHVNTTEDELIDPHNENPPDLSQAPPGPYLKDRMGGVENWIIGLGNDELGYLIPAYDYKLSETAPYLEEAPGDHYEETNSIGPSATPLVEEMATRLIEWAP